MAPKKACARPCACRRIGCARSASQRSCQPHLHRTCCRCERSRALHLLPASAVLRVTLSERKCACCLSRAAGLRQRISNLQCSMRRAPPLQRRESSIPEQTTHSISAYRQQRTRPHQPPRPRSRGPRRVRSIKPAMRSRSICVAQCHSSTRVRTSPRHPLPRSRCCLPARRHRCPPRHLHRFLSRRQPLRWQSQPPRRRSPPRRRQTPSPRRQSPVAPRRRSGPGRSRQTQPRGGRSTPRRALARPCWLAARRRHGPSPRLQDPTLRMRVRLVCQRTPRLGIPTARRLPCR